MSTVSAVDPATLVSPVVLALEQVEQQERELATQAEDAKRTAAAAQQLAHTFAERLVQARSLRDELRRLASSHAPAKGRAVRPTPPPVPVMASAAGARPVKGHAGVVAAASRELVVLRLVDGGATDTKAIREAMTVPPGITAEQHRASVQNALSRLKTVRGFITNAGEGWALTARGRKHLAAVKEAP